MIHKFRINVVQEVEVEIDDAVFNDKFFQEFASYMFEVDMCEMAEYIARQKALYDGYQIEGVPPEGEGYKARIVDDYAEEA